MPKIHILYKSDFGNAARKAKSAVEEVSSVPGAKALLKKADDELFEFGEYECLTDYFRL